MQELSIKMGWFRRGRNLGRIRYVIILFHFLDTLYMSSCTTEINRKFKITAVVNVQLHPVQN